MALQRNNIARLIFGLFLALNYAAGSAPSTPAAVLGSRSFVATSRVRSALISVCAFFALVSVTQYNDTPMDISNLLCGRPPLPPLPSSPRPRGAPTRTAAERPPPARGRAALRPRQRAPVRVPCVTGEFEQTKMSVCREKSVALKNRATPQSANSAPSYGSTTKRLTSKVERQTSHRLGEETEKNLLICCVGRLRKKGVRNLNWRRRKAAPTDSLSKRSFTSKLD